MLYLAEVQRKARVLGSSKPELKLMACQRSEQNWSACDETIQAPDDLSYSTGALIMVELTPNKQVKRHLEAGRQLVSILQNFSRLQDRAKAQEDEIEQWKQSLTYQSQELNRREMEMEARQEQLQEMEGDFERLEQQRREIEATRTEVDQLKSEYDRRMQELEGAWAQLNGEMQRLDDRQTEIRQSATLDEHQAAQIQNSLSRLSSAVAPTEMIREQIHASFETMNQQQALLAQHQQHLEQHQESAQQLQAEVEQEQVWLQSQWQEWHQAQEALEQLKTSLTSQQDTLALKQSYGQALIGQSQNYSALQQEMLQLVDSSAMFTIGAKVDLDALEKMPLDELQRVVQELERELEKNSSFVNSQEEELRFKQEDIDNLKARIDQASEYDRLQLEAEIKDEQDGYQMLNETLVGQRRNLREREAVLKQHQIVLARRQGHPTGEGSNQEVDIQPVLNRLEGLKHQLTEEVESINAQIQQIQTTIADLQVQVEAQSAQQEAKRAELKQAEDGLQTKRSRLSEFLGKVHLYQDLLQPTQQQAIEVTQKLEAIAALMSQFQESSDYQLQAISEMQQVIAQLTAQPSPEFAAS